MTSHMLPFTDATNATATQAVCCVGLAFSLARSNRNFTFIPAEIVWTAGDSFCFRGTAHKEADKCINDNDNKVLKLNKQNGAP